MKIFQYIIILFTIILFNSNALAQNCDDIKMNSSVNIIKKLKCKAGKDVTVANSENSTSSESLDEDDTKWKIWKKPKWMKKD